MLTASPRVINSVSMLLVTCMFCPTCLPIYCYSSNRLLGQHQISALDNFFCHRFNRNPACQLRLGGLIIVVFPVQWRHTAGDHHHFHLSPGAFVVARRAIVIFAGLYAQHSAVGASDVFRRQFIVLQHRCGIQVAGDLCNSFLDLFLHRVFLCVALLQYNSIGAGQCQLQLTEIVIAVIPGTFAGHTEVLNVSSWTTNIAIHNNTHQVCHGHSVAVFVANGSPRTGHYQDPVIQRVDPSLWMNAQAECPSRTALAKVQ